MDGTILFTSLPHMTYAYSYHSTASLQLFMLELKRGIVRFQVALLL